MMFFEVFNSSICNDIGEIMLGFATKRLQITFWVDRLSRGNRGLPGRWNAF